MPYTDEFDERHTDPLMKVTTHLTNAIKRFKKLFGVQDSTRVMSRADAEYFSKYDFLGSPYGLNNPMYTYLSHLDQALRVSHEGRGREELVILGSGMQQGEMWDNQQGIMMVRDFRKRQRALKDFDSELPDMEERT
jgi:hypothetical protein